MDAPRKSDTKKSDAAPAPKPEKSAKDGKAPKVEKVNKKPGRKKALEARTALTREVADEVQALRGVFSDILEIYRSRVDGQLAGLSGAFREAEREGNPPPERVLRAMVETIRTLKVKPPKGRGKDLARIEALAECLWEILPPGH
jgi:hypothetical protein